MTIKNMLKRFKNDRRAIAPIWIVAGITLFTFPIIYWALGLALDGVTNEIFIQYTLVGPPATAWTLVKALVSALPVFVVLTVVIWSFVQAKQPRFSE
jgi:hypothetical protein